MRGRRSNQYRRVRFEVRSEQKRKWRDSPVFWRILSVLAAVCFLSGIGTYAESGYAANEIGALFLLICLAVWFFMISRKKNKKTVASEIETSSITAEVDKPEASPVEVVYAHSLIEVDQMNGIQFEHFCADLLRKAGFSGVSVTPASNDQGVDVLAEKDGIKYAFQCKNYSSPLGNTPVQEVNTGKQIYGCQIGVVLTNTTFTTGAKTAAESTGVLLWDRNKLADLIKQYQTEQETITAATNIV